jgi:hypothetical protein
MAWTVTTDLRNYLLSGGSLQQAVTGGSLRIMTSGSVVLSTHAVGTPSPSGANLTVPFGQALVGAGITNSTAALGEIRNTGGQVLLSTNSVGTTGADIPFNQVTGWKTDDVIQPGATVITLAVAVS